MKVYVYRLLLESSSIPLAILCYIYALSGYGLMKSDLVERLSFGLLDYRTSLEIHTSPLIRLFLIFLAIMHSIAGFLLLVQRLRNSLIRKLCEYIIVALGIVVAIQFLLLELL